MRDALVRGLHVLALGLWFGGAGFFNFVTAPSIFESFKEVVQTAPSDRTAGIAIVPPGTSDEAKNNLASALGGAAVGPVFPKYFAMQAVCGLVALLTALSWWTAEGGRKVHRRRVYLIALAVLTVAAGWPISDYVSELRLHRFDSEAGKAAFVSWHLVSLLLSFVTVCLAGVALALAARLPLEAEGEKSPPVATGGL
jgi:hypothetical protein